MQLPRATAPVLLACLLNRDRASHRARVTTKHSSRATPRLQERSAESRQMLVEIVRQEEESGGVEKKIDFEDMPDDSDEAHPPPSELTPPAAAPSDAGVCAACLTRAAHVAGGRARAV